MEQTGFIKATAHVCPCLVALVLYSNAAHGQDFDASEVPSRSVVDFDTDTSFTIRDEKTDATPLTSVEPPEVSHDPVSNADDLDEFDLNEFDLRQSVRDSAAARQRALQQLSGLSPQISVLFDHTFNQGDLLDSHNKLNRIEEFSRNLTGLLEDTHTTSTLSRLEERLDDLEQVLKQPPACPEILPTQEPKDPPESQHVTEDESEDPDVLPPPSYSEIAENAKQPEAVQEDNPPDEPIVEAIAVTDAPVDRMSLANNLYGAGEYELALKSYQELETLDNLPPQDKVWIQYQIGSCHHRLGDTSAAQRSFRRVAAVEQQSHWGKHARWWLHTNERTNRLQSHFEQFQLEMNQLQEQRNEPAKP